MSVAINAIIHIHIHTHCIYLWIDALVDDTFEVSINKVCLYEVGILFKLYSTVDDVLYGLTSS